MCYNKFCWKNFDNGVDKDVDLCYNFPDRQTDRQTDRQLSLRCLC